MENAVDKKIALFGAVGNPNVGDEAILEANIQKIKNIYGNRCIIYVFTKDATYTSLYCGKEANIVSVDYLHQYTVSCGYDVFVMKQNEEQLFEDETNHKYHLVHKIFREIDALHIIGGGYINSLWPDIMYEMCLAVKLAKLYHKKYCFTGISIYPFNHQYITDLREALVSAEFIDFRDASYKYLNLNQIDFIRTADDAITLKPKKTILKLQNYGCICLHEWKGNNDELIQKMTSVLVPFMKYCIEEHIVDGFYIIGFSSGDLKLWKNIDIEDIKEYILFEDIYLDGEILAAKYIVANAKFNIGSRFHQAVFSLSSKVPVLSISYDNYYRNKLDSIHFTYRVDNIIDLEDFNQQSLENYISHLDEIKQDLIDIEPAVLQVIKKKDQLLYQVYENK